MAGEVTIKSQEDAKSENKYIGEDKARYSAAIDYNVLHNYRSYNYILTLSALTREEYKDPTFFKNNPPLNYVVLKSSGKGITELSATSESLSIFNEITDGANPLGSDAVQATLDEFNSNGYGRFDFFIDNLEVDTVWNTTNGSQPCKIRFDVYEPLSVNGFLESIRINALAAGFENHLDCPFVIKIEFIGYPKGEDLPDPQPVEYATRYLPVNINGVSLETSESGTKYKVACTSKNGMGQGEDGKLAATAKMRGKNVREVLTSLMEQITESRKNDSGGKEETKYYNEYKIVFLDGPKKPVKEIEEAEINDHLRSNQVYVFPELSEKDPDGKSAVKLVTPQNQNSYDSKEETIAFASGSSILDIITAVIRDSKYTEVLLGKIQDVIDNNKGLVPWFRVNVSTTEIKEGKNPKTNQTNYVYTYTVRPYMIHYSKLPGMGSGMFDGEEIKDQIRRNYEYLYTGKNVDILNFNLKFNHLFFQQRPFKLGSKDLGGTGAAAAASESKDLEETPIEQDGQTDGQTPVKRLVVTGESNQQPAGGSGKDYQATAYFKIGQMLNDALIDGVDFNNISLTIIGDPYYLVTSALGNEEEEEDIENPGITTNGQAPYLGGDVLININFRTPKDIKPNGFADFGEDLLPFSGIFKVTDVINTFNQGKFEQKIRAYRLPGQVIKAKKIVKAAIPEESVHPGEAPTKDTASSSVARSGIRASDASIANLLNRGLPTLSIAGEIANFTNSIGQALTPLIQVGGLIAAANQLINGFDNPGGAPGLSNPSIGYNPYSEGIRVNTDGLADVTGGDQNFVSSVAVQSRIVSSFVQDSTNLRVLNQNYYNNVLSERLTADSGKLSDVKSNSLAVTNSNPVDPKALAHRLGLDPKELSGLSGSQQSDLLGQLAKLASQIPENTDIAGLKALGLSLTNIYAKSLPNLPALQPLTVAPLANIPIKDLQKILDAGGNIANLPGALTLPGIAAFLAALKSGKNIPNNGLTGGQGQLNAQSTFDKIETAQGLSINLTGSKGISPAELGNGSVESQIAGTRQVVQGYGGYYVNVKTAYAQYGTRKTDSPIDTLMKQRSS